MRLLNFWQTPSIGIEFIINLIIFHFHEFYSSYSSFLCFVPPPLSHTILFELVLDNILSTLEYYVSIFDEFKCNPPPPPPEPDFHKSKQDYKPDMTSNRYAYDVVVAEGSHLNYSYGDRLSHVTNGETSKRWEFLERFDAQWLSRD